MWWMQTPPACGLFGGSNGNVAPTATIGGSNTGLSGPEGIALDSGGNIYVADANAASVFVYPAGASGQRCAHRHHQREQHRPESHGIALDQREHLCGGQLANSVTVYRAGSNGNVAPSSAHHQHDHDHRPTTAISVSAKLAVGKSTLGNPVSKNLDVKNAGKADLFIRSVSVSGANAGDFAPGRLDLSGGRACVQGQVHDRGGVHAERARRA